MRYMRFICSEMANIGIISSIILRNVRSGELQKFLDRQTKNGPHQKAGFAWLFDVNDVQEIMFPASSSSELAAPINPGQGACITQVGIFARYELNLPFSSKRARNGEAAK